MRLDLARIRVDAIAFQRLAKRNDFEALLRVRALLRGKLLDDLETTDPAYASWLAQERRRFDDTTEPFENSPMLLFSPVQTSLAG